MKHGSSKIIPHQTVRVRTSMDYPWKVLDKLVDDLSCSLLPDEISQLKQIVRKRDYAAYLGLSEAWGPQGITSSGMRIDNFFARYQASALLKKFRFPSDNKSRKAAALEKFKAAEQACANFNRDGWRTLACLSDPDELACFTYARQFLSRLLGEELPSYDQLTFWSRHGPGSNLDTKDRQVSAYHKYKAWPYSCTSGTLSLARSTIEADERWLGALEDDYRQQNGIEPWRILDREVFWSSVLNVVPGNRITFVPKNALTDRSIAIEPAMNLYLQLGVDGYIRNRLKRWGVDLDSQEKNQQMAGDGSKYWTTEDPFVTLDLAAASDSVSLELCRLLLPPQWYTYLIRLRSPRGECEGEVFNFEKISSMGNGYTFALESAIFTSVVYGVEKLLKGSLKPNEFAVYGDDIIVRKSSSALVIRMLHLFGFALNHDKSFVEGPFRESCGADWYSGTSVRPVFLTSNPTTVMELWSDANRLRRILSLRQWGFEFNVTRLIESWVPPQFTNCVGPVSDTTFDSYVHRPTPVARRRNGTWMYSHLTVSFKRLRGEHFLMRKLMHTLRPALTKAEPHSRINWGGAKVTDAGSVFAITSTKSVIVSHTSSPAWEWQDEYRDIELRGGYT